MHHRPVAVVEAAVPPSPARQAICQKIGGVSGARAERQRSTVPSPLQSTSKPCSATIASMRGT